GGDGAVHAFQVNTGKHVWSYHFAGEMINGNPVVNGDHVIIGHGDLNDDSAELGRIVCVDASKVKDKQPEVVWKIDGRIKAKFASPTLLDGRLYMPNDLGLLFCLDAKTGEQKWVTRYGKNTKGSPVIGDGKLYIGDVDGTFSIYELQGDKAPKLLQKQQFAAEINGTPSIVNSRVYFLTSEECYCLAAKDGKPEPGTPPALPKNEPAPQGAKVATVQVFPADITVHPGEAIDFTVKTFDDKGRLIGTAKGAWSL